MRYCQHEDSPHVRNSVHCTCLNSSSHQTSQQQQQAAAIKSLTSSLSHPPCSSPSQPSPSRPLLSTPLHGSFPFRTLQVVSSLVTPLLRATVTRLAQPSRRVTMMTMSTLLAWETASLASTRTQDARSLLTTMLSMKMTVRSSKATGQRLSMLLSARVASAQGQHFNCCQRGRVERDGGI